MIRLKMHYASWVREGVGRTSEMIDVPADITTVAELIGWLAQRHPGTDVFDDRRRLRCAVDNRVLPLEAQLAGAHEVDIFPPVSGG